MVAGTSTIRTRVASMSIATARPSPICLMTSSGPRANERNTMIMMAAAAVITLAVAASPSATASPLSSVFTHSSRMRESRKTS